MYKTFSQDIRKKKMKIVPQLDFSNLKNIREFKNWYKYSLILEENIKELQHKIKWIAEDMEEGNRKNSHLRKQNSNLYILNKKLVLTVKKLKKKIVEVKGKYNQRVRKAQKYGVDALETTISRFDTELTSDY